MKKVACVGEAMIELSMRGGQASVGVAGDTLNTAIYLKRAAPELEIDYVSCLGDDPFSDQIATFIDAQEIGTSRIRRLEGRAPGLYAITTTESGERSFTYWRHDSAARRLFQIGNAFDFTCLEGYDVIYLSAITLAILPEHVRRGLLAWLETNPVHFAFDSNYRPRLWESPQAARNTMADFWPRADIVLPSVDDEMALHGESEEAVVARFEAHPGQGALKRGDRGPMSIGQAVDQPYEAARAVVDTTAAGDSFNGGYLGAILTGASQAASLQAGHRLAARVVSHPGAIIPADAP
ncbi:MAG: sugar kinase [Pseudomonadota bacterium]